MLTAIYLVAGEGKRLRPLTDERPKAMIEVGGMSLAQRALRSLRAAGIERIVAVTGHAASELDRLGELISDRRFNARYADTNNVYSLWCARDVVAGGCYIVNSDVLFEQAIADRLVAARGSTLLCASDHGVDAESMKVVERDGRVVGLSKDAPASANAEYVGLARVEAEHGPLLAEILEGFVSHERLDAYYEDALQQLAARVPVASVTVDGLAWIEIDDHDDLVRAQGEVVERVA